MTVWPVFVGIVLAFFTAKMSMRKLLHICLLMLVCSVLRAQSDTAAVKMKPMKYDYIPVYGFTESIGFGAFKVSHWEKFFSTLSGYNVINIPQMFISQQMMIGNTLKIARNFYLANGILYGAQLGVEGNNWGLGNREGFLWRPKPTMAILVWNQYFQSLTVYTPVLYPRADGNSAAIVMPATPEVFSFGVQASFNVGHFIIGVGTSVSPVPFQDRKKSKFRYR